MIEPGNFEIGGAPAVPVDYRTAASARLYDQKFHRR
jgi:hypothetical protein